jgi:predicted cobalt transporter CbtA
MQKNLKETTFLFVGGVGAGIIAFICFGAIWQVTYFWWVMTATAMACGLLAVLFRRNFKNMLDALLDNAPWI